MIRVLIIIMVILGVLFLVGGGYFLGLQSSNSAKNESNFQPAPSVTATPSAPSSPEPTSTPSPSPAASPSPSPAQTVTDTGSVIKDAFINENFDNVKPVLANSVMLITYATSCCGEESDPQKIIEFMAGSNNARAKLLWSFNPADSKYDNIRKIGDFFAIAKTGEAFTFELDGSGKLNKIIFYADYRLAAN